jgi:hypothetical protein
MSYLNSNVLDSGLSWLQTNGTRLDICSQEPVSYSEATTDAAYSLGYKTSLSIGAPGARSPDGRKVTVPEITDGTVTETDTATHWAITDGSSVLVATGSLSSGQAVTDGNTFTLTSFDIGIPGPA